MIIVIEFDDGRHNSLYYSSKYIYINISNSSKKNFMIQ